MVADGGYHPARVEIAGGERVRLCFVRPDYGGCTRDMVLTLGLPRELPTGRPVPVDLPALPAGETAFECGMGMALIVVGVHAAPWPPVRP